MFLCVSQTRLIRGLGHHSFHIRAKITVIRVTSVHRDEGPSLFHVGSAGRKEQYLTAHICPTCVRTYIESVLQGTWAVLFTTSKTAGFLF